MKKPDPRKFLGCPAELRRYISHLEHNLSLHDSHRAAVIQWETTMMRLVGEDGIADVEKAINKLKAKAQQATLDQFAMAALPVAHDQVQELPTATLKRVIGKEGSALPITGEEVRQAVAVTAYLIAEAMQAESQKRQGGAA